MARQLIIEVLLIMLAVAVVDHNDAKSAPESTTSASSAPPSPLRSAEAEFTKGSWDIAIPLYKTHLRTYPNDYHAWNRLAACYYQTGQVRLALETFKRVERSSVDRSFNYFYQGMCLAVLGSEKDAIKFWEYAAFWLDDYGAKATFELAASYYRISDDVRAKQWLTIYTKKYPKGADLQGAKDLLKSMDDGKRVDPVKSFDRPDPDATIYRYHPWSLMKIPHFWKIQVGVASIETNGYEPARAADGTGTISESVNQDTAMMVNASIGVGPIRQKNLTSFAGYTYKQNWITTVDSIPLWFQNGLSLDSFPLQGNLMERSHQFFGDMRRQMTNSLYLGAYGRLQYNRVGSSFFPSPDDSSLKVVTPTTDTQLLIPWAGWTWSETMRSMLSLYLRKEIHNQSPEHSNKTFDFTGATSSPSVSLGLSHAMEFPTIRLETTFDLFQYQFIFNDYWLDYTRTGGLIGADYVIYKGFGANTILGYYQDQYKLPRIKTGSCDSETPGSIVAGAVACSRADSGNMIQLGLYYNRNTNLKFEASYLMVDNSSNLKVYSASQNTIKVTTTWAFPGTKRVSRMTERFADAAFTKDAESD